MPINTMEKNDLYLLKQDSYDKERFILDVIEDNSGIKEYSINKERKIRQVI